ncbi:MAG: hypothetical protein ACOCV8_00255 [Spirochaetota bacterium]
MKKLISLLLLSLIVISMLGCLSPETDEVIFKVKVVNDSKKLIENNYVELTKNEKEAVNLYSEYIVVSDPTEYDVDNINLRKVVSDRKKSLISFSKKMVDNINNNSRMPGGLLEVRIPDDDDDGVIDIVLIQYDENGNVIRITVLTLNTNTGSTTIIDDYELTRTLTGTYKMLNRVPVTNSTFTKTLSNGVKVISTDKNVKVNIVDEKNTQAYINSLAKK